MHFVFLVKEESRKISKVDVKNRFYKVVYQLFNVD
jgi:hypothetical protein